MHKVEVSVCCKATPIEDFIENPLDHHDPVPVYVCSKCKRMCDVESVCSECFGTGEVTVDEEVYINEPHIRAPIGTRKCLCKQQ